MRAVILAAGLGRRLGRPLPKCLLEVRGQTLLERHLAALGACGVRAATIVVGFEQARIRRHPAVARWEGRVEFCENPDFARGNILSLRHGLRDAGGPLLVMDADVLYPPALLARLAASPAEMAFLVDARARPTGEEMMVGVRDGRAVAIGRRIGHGFERTGETVGFTRLGARAVPLVRLAADGIAADGRLDADYEEAFARVLPEVEAAAVDASDLPWTEIDFEEDLARAEREVLPGIGR